MTARAALPYLIAALLIASLAGCAAPGTAADDSLAAVFTAPDRFVLYNCEQLARTATTAIERERELRALTAQAGPSPDGQLVSALSYRSEQLSLRGDLIELRKAAVAKNCKSMPVEGEGGRASDRALR
jgi:hypothetical protein